MPLDEGCADVVRFNCQKCGTESGLRSIRNTNGACFKCQNPVWTLMTEYHEGPPAIGLLPILLRLVFGIRMRRTNYETIRIVTDNVLAADAMKIALANWHDHKYVAHRYVEYRRNVDGELA